MENTIQIGEITITQFEDGQIWLRHPDGEGMEVNKTDFLEVVKDFYNDNF